MAAAKCASPQTTSSAKLHPRPYLIQWDRVLRWREPLGSAASIRGWVGLSARSRVRVAETSRRHGGCDVSALRETMSGSDALAEADPRVVEDAPGVAA
jgi:hypothetical protein